MTDLTEQWKKGELPEGFYWVKVKEEFANYPILADCVRRYEYYDVYTYFPEYEDSITAILEPVPSYKEWLEKTKSLKVLAEAYCKEKQKNDEIKELLKEWVQFEIEENPNDFTVMSERMSGLANKTKEALEK